MHTATERLHTLHTHGARRRATDAAARSSAATRRTPVGCRADATRAARVCRGVSAAVCRQRDGETRPRSMQCARSTADRLMNRHAHYTHAHTHAHTRTWRVWQSVRRSMSMECTPLPLRGTRCRAVNGVVQRQDVAGGRSGRGDLQSCSRSASLWWVCVLSARVVPYIRGEEACTRQRALQRTGRHVPSSVGARLFRRRQQSVCKDNTYASPPLPVEVGRPSVRAALRWRRTNAQRLAQTRTTVDATQNHARHARVAPDTRHASRIAHHTQPHAHVTRDAQRVAVVVMPPTTWETCAAQCALNAGALRSSHATLPARHPPPRAARAARPIPRAPRTQCRTADGRRVTPPTTGIHTLHHTARPTAAAACYTHGDPWSTHATHAIGHTLRPGM